jgi:uncharacterized protein
MSNHVIVQRLSEFVAETTKGRDKSHGHEHMSQVADNAIEIMKDMDVSIDQYRWALIVSWLHDVADHKYDRDGSLAKRVFEFLKSLEPENAKYLMDCINMVSFSAETREGYKYYEKVLPPKWVIVRNIASDADKLEALGATGVVRCSTYAQLKSEVKLSAGDVVQYVWEHAKIKLLLLAIKFIHTRPAKLMAIPLHLDMMQWFIASGISKRDVYEYAIPINRVISTDT